MNILDLKKRMNDSATREAAILEFADWSRDIVLGFGSEFSTAVLVGSAMARGLDRDLPDARNLDAASPGAAPFGLLVAN